MKKLLILFTIGFLTLTLKAQVTYETNDPGVTPIPLGFLGWNDNSNTNLDIRQNNIIRMRFSAEFWPGYNNIGPVNNVNRIFVPSNSGVTQGNVFSILQLGDDLDNNLERDWMHKGLTIGAGNDIFWSGIIQDPENDDNQTGGDAVIAWGDNEDPEDNGPDNFRFLFISELTSDTLGPNSDQGLETMRITPQGNLGIGNSFSNTIQPHRRTVVHERTDSAQFRIAWGLHPNPLFGRHADFQVTNNGVLHIKNRANNERRPLVVGFLEEEDDDPTELTWLDVGGITRIRELPEDSAKSCLILGSFADTTALGDSADHYLTRLDFTGATDSVLSGAGTWVALEGFDCRWEDIPSSNIFGEEDIRLGYDPAYECYRQNVAIGAENAKAKFHVYSLTERDSFAIGSQFEIEDNLPSFDVSANSGVVTALRTLSTGVNTDFGTDYVGLQSRSRAGRYSVGLDARAETGSIFTIGVYSKATGTLNLTQGNDVGVYSEVGSSGTSFVGWGGSLAITGGPLILSDESIKTDVEEIAEASPLLMQLVPKSYQLTSPENRPSGFVEGIQYGLIAQEVEEILPDIVREISIPEMRDSSGAFIEGTALSLKGVEYRALIPFLIKGFQEQTALITDQAGMLAEQEVENEELEAQVEALSEQLEAQAAQMAEMQNQMTQVMASFQSTQSKMNNCCGTVPSEKASSETGVRLRSPSKEIKLEQNFPNPFDEMTTINFSLDRAAQIRLEISDAQGRVLDVLVNTNLKAGEYTERWDASAYAPGTYYYSLYADTDLLTKKMIKR